MILRRRRQPSFSCRPVRPDASPSWWAVCRAAAVLLILLLALALAGCGGSSSSSSPSGGATATTGSGGGLSGPYPTPQDQTFQGCPPQGDGGDSQLNVKKNRIDTGDWQRATVASLVSLPYPSDVGKRPRDSWTSSDVSAVAQYEGRPVQAEGYLLLVRHEGTESVNCHDASARDFHMWLAAAPGSTRDRANSMIVEVTPRSRALNSGWQPDSRLLGLTGHHVRISGWLLLDQEHPEQLDKTRGTLWEIHPVMKIEVDNNGSWVDLNDQSLSIAGGPPDTTGTSSSGRYHSSSHHHGRHSSNG
jgi:hypothetical protein